MMTKRMGNHRWRTMSTVGVLLLALGAWGNRLDAGNWSQFRGPQNAGVAAPSDRVPTTWNVGEKKNVAWRVDLPGRGPSSPIVVRDRVIVTASDGVRQDRLHVLAFDATSGRPLWHRQFWATGRTMTHPSSAVAAPTPASDGQAIYAFYSSNDLVCLDLDGNLRWYRGLTHDFPKAGNDVGMSSSPVVIDDTVVVQVENQGDSFLAAIQAVDGQTRWQVPRPTQANWSSPVVTTLDNGETLVLAKSGEGLDAYDLRSGRKVWTYSTPASGIASTVALSDRVFLPAEGMTLLKLAPAGATPQATWTANRLNPGPTSPVVAGEQVYIINRAGVLVCANLSDGEMKWQLRLNGSFWATPVLAGEHLVCINEAGLAQVVELGDKPKVVGKNDFQETIQSSPAVANQGLFVRSDKSLWKIALTAE